MNFRLQKAAGNRGFSLVELMVVVAIMGILLAVGAYNFAGWTGRYRAESFTRDLQAAVMEARMSAIQSSRAHCMILNSPDAQANLYGTYLVKRDMNNEAIEDATLCTDAADALLPGYPKPIDQDDPTKSIPSTTSRTNNSLFLSAANQVTEVRFTPRGMLVDTTGTMVTRTILKVNYRGECFFAGECPGGALADRRVFPDVDCIVITPTQVNVGLGRIDPATNLWDGANCDVK